MGHGLVFENQSSKTMNPRIIVSKLLSKNKCYYTARANKSLFQRCG